MNVEGDDEDPDETTLGEYRDGRRTNYPRCMFDPSTMSASVP